MFTLNNFDSQGNEAYAFLKKENTVGILSDKFKTGSIIWLYFSLFLIFLIPFLCWWMLRILWAFLHRRYLLADEDEDQNQHELQNITYSKKYVDFQKCST